MDKLDPGIERRVGRPRASNTVSAHYKRERRNKNLLREKEKDRLYREKNKDRIKKYSQQWWLKNKEGVDREVRRKAVEKWAKNNPEKVKLIRRECYLKNKEIEIAKSREYQKNHPEYVAHNRKQQVANIKQWIKNHPEKFKQYRRKHYLSNRGKIIMKSVEYQKNHPECVSRIRKEQCSKKKQKLESRAGRPKPLFCEICNEKRNRIVFDHDHKTGKFRGWICNTCNSALGFVDDNPNILKRMLEYLISHN